MKILVLGSGAKEHALIWKLLKSEREVEIIAAPGNGGISELVECLDVDITDADRILELAIVRNIDLTIVGSSESLQAGIVDKFRESGHRILGPSKEAAEVECSKFFAKEFMYENRIPTARYASFDNHALASVYVQSQKFPTIIKADRIVGKEGTVIAHDLETAQAAVDKFFADPRSGGRVIFEEMLEGIEIAIVTVCDGNDALSLLPVQNYSHIETDGKQVTTEGIGAYAPVPFVSPETMERIRHKIINPTMNNLRMQGKPYMGFLRFKIILDKELNPTLLEYKCNMGDPAAQVIMPLFDEDLVEVCRAASREDLSSFEGSFHKYLGSALSVVLTSDGYPGDFEQGKLISFSALNSEEPSLNGNPVELEQVLKAKSLIFHDGTKKLGHEFITAGGRVVSATAIAENLVDAQVLAYKLAEQINFDGKSFRRDIGDKGMV